MLISTDIVNDFANAYSIRIVDTNFGATRKVEYQIKGAWIPSRIFKLVAVIREYEARKLNVPQAIAQYYWLAHQYYGDTKISWFVLENDKNTHIDKYFMAGRYAAEYYDCVVRQLQQRLFPTPNPSWRPTTNIK